MPVGGLPGANVNRSDPVRILRARTADAHVPRMRTASAAAFFALSTPTAATGTPGGIWAIARSASSPSSTLFSERSGTPIAGIDEAEAAGALVFHAGTARRGQELLTNGGRILNVTALGADLPSARAAAYEAVGLISFPGMRFRSDIGLAAAEGHVRS